MSLIKFCFLTLLTAWTVFAGEVPVFQRYTGNPQSAGAILNGPRHLVVTTNYIYSTDESNFRAIAIDFNGQIQKTFDSIDPNDKTFRPYGIAVDSLGNVYISDSLSNHKIYKFAPNGSWIKSFGGFGSGLGQFNQPRGLAFAQNGDLLVVDAYNHRIQRLDLSTNSWTSWGNLGSGNGQFNLPSDIKVDSVGDIWVLDTGNFRVQKFDSNGQFLAAFGSQGTGANQLGSFSSAINFDGNGKLLISDYGNQRILRWDSLGVADLAFSTPTLNDTNRSSPYGIGTLSDGTIIVADGANHVLKEFDETGAFLADIGTRFDNPSQLDTPIGLDVDTAGKLFVAGSDDVKIFAVNGTLERSFEMAGVRAVHVTDDEILACRPHEIQIFDLQGVYKSSFGSFGTGNNQFNYPADLAWDAVSDNCYVADLNNNRILVYDGQWSYLTTIGVGTVQKPNRVRLDSNGDLYVSENNSYRILKFLKNGDFDSYVELLGDPNGEIRQFPLSMDLDAADNLFVADRVKGQVLKFDNQLGFKYSFGKTGTGPIEFNSALDIKMDNVGNLHVLDTRNHRIQSFTMAIPNLAFAVNAPVDQGVVVTALPEFDWNPASSLLGVRYELTVATDLGLTQVVYNPSNLETTSHLATTAFADGTYYWSITVTDAAANSWTSPKLSFTVNTTIAPVIESLTMFKASLRLNDNADIRSQVGNHGANPISGVEILVRVTPPGQAATDLPANVISTLNPGASVNFSDLFSGTQVEGVYAVEAILRDIATLQVYDTATTSFSVGAPTITRSVLLGTDYRGGFLSTTAPSFSSTIRNGSSLAMPIQHQIQVLDSMENPVLDNLGDPVCLASVAVPALASGANDLADLTAPLLPAGNYIARFSAVNGDACNGPGITYDLIDVPFAVSDLVLSNLSVANAFQDNIAAISLRVTNQGTTTMSDLTVVVEVLLPNGQPGANQPDPVTITSLAGGLVSNLNLSYALPIDASLGVYGLSASLFVGTEKVQELTGSFTVLKPISITRMTAARITGQGGKGIKLSQLTLQNDGLTARNVTVRADAKQAGVVLFTGTLTGIILQPGSSNLGGNLSFTTDIGIYDVTVEIIEDVTQNVLATQDALGVDVR